MICTPRADLTTRIVEDEVVILDKKTGRIHQLNSTASFVWNRLDGRTSLPTIVSDMVREFTTEIEIARADVARVLAELVRLELVTAEPASGPDPESPADGSSR